MTFSKSNWHIDTKHKIALYLGEIPPFMTKAVNQLLFNIHDNKIYQFYQFNIYSIKVVPNIYFVLLRLTTLGAFIHIEDAVLLV